MTTAHRRRTAAPLAALAALLIAGLATASPAAADNNLGQLTFNPGKGLDTSPVWVATSGPCPAAADFISVTMFGKGIPAEGLLVTTPTKAGLSRTDRMLAAFQDNLAGLASSSGFTISGTYKVVLNCQDKFGTKIYGSYTGSMAFSDAHHYTASGVALEFPRGELPGGVPVIASPSASAAPSGSNAPSASSNTSAGNGQSASPTGSAAPSAAPDGVTTASGERPATSSNPNWIFFGLGGLLVLLGLGWIVRSRAAERTQPSDAPSAREDEHVAG